MASRSPIAPLQVSLPVSSHADFVKSLEKKRSSEVVVATNDVSAREPSAPPAPAALPAVHSHPLPAVFPVGDSSRGVVIIKEKRPEPPSQRRESVPKMPELIGPGVPGSRGMEDRMPVVEKAVKVSQKQSGKAHTEKGGKEGGTKERKSKAEARGKVAHKSEHRHPSPQDDPHEWLLEHYASPSPRSRPELVVPPAVPNVIIGPGMPPVPSMRVPVEARPKPQQPKAASPPPKPTHKPAKSKAKQSHPPLPADKPERGVSLKPSVDADIDMELSLAAETSSKAAKKHTHHPPKPKREASMDMDVDNELLSLLDDEPRPKQSKSPQVPMAKSPVPPSASAPVEQLPKAKQKKSLLDHDHSAVKRATPTPSVASERESMPPPPSTHLGVSREESAASSSRDGSVAPGGAGGKKKDTAAKVRTFELALGISLIQ